MYTFKQACYNPTEKLLMEYTIEHLTTAYTYGNNTQLEKIVLYYKALYSLELFVRCLENCSDVIIQVPIWRQICHQCRVRNAYPGGHPVFMLLASMWRQFYSGELFPIVREYNEFKYHEEQVKLVIEGDKEKYKVFQKIDELVGKDR
jgi:hypothetical protein